MWDEWTKSCKAIYSFSVLWRGYTRTERHARNEIFEPYDAILSKMSALTEHVKCSSTAKQWTSKEKRKVSKSITRCIKLLIHYVTIDLLPLLSWDNCQKRTLTKYPCNRSLLFLSDLPFVEASQYMKIYMLFSVETMHLFHQGVSRMLKKASVVQLRRITYSAEYYRAMERATRKFVSPLKAAKLRQVNKFVEDICSYSEGKQIVLYVCNI